MSQMSTEARLVHMANQIAANFAIAGAEKAALATADHLASFWDPRMRERIIAHLDARDGGHGELAPIARHAVELLRSHAPSSPQSGATVFGRAGQTGGSDAG